MGGGATQGTDLPQGRWSSGLGGNREEDVSREEFSLSWHWRTAFSIGCGLVPYSTQISLEEDGHSEELP